MSGDRVFTVETKSKQDEIVRAFSRKDGKQLWEASWPGSMRVPFYAAKNGSWVRSTPATDGKSLFVGGMRD
ncbi:MAG: pyrrolo-quinoline quinone, partial [Akkermansiaceae bacterium]